MKGVSRLLTNRPIPNRPFSLSRSNQTSLRLRRLALAAGLIGILGASLSGCGGTGTTPPPGGGGFANPPTADFGNFNRSVCTANAHTNGRARWTLLVYMNGANNLQPDSLTNVAQMAAAGSDANVNIVIQWKQSTHCLPTYDCGTPSFNGTRRYFLKPHSQADVNAIGGGNTTSLDPDRLPNPTTNAISQSTPEGTSDMGNYRTLQDFVQWGTTNYPADHMAVVVWDHGSGWENVYRSAKTGRSITRKSRAVSQDDENHSEIETWELPPAFSSAVQPIDMIILDCSLEQMTEVAYELRKSARVMVGSEESPPGPGYPYDLWINDLKSSGKNPCDVGNSIVNEFLAFYKNNPGLGYTTNLTQSMVDLSKMDGLATALNSFADSLRLHAQDQQNVIANARANVQSYANPDYQDNKDLYDFADKIRTNATANDLKQAAFNMQSALVATGGAVIVQGHGASGQTGSTGLAIYIPSAQNYLTTYSNLALARSTHWDEFLQGQVK